MEEDNYIVLSGEDEPHPGAASGEAPLKSMCDEGRALWRRTNHNVKFILIIVAFAGLSESLAFGSALASYLYMATGACNPTDRCGSNRQVRVHYGIPTAPRTRHDLRSCTQLDATRVGDSNVSVGYLESALGLSKLLTALPMGDLAGRMCVVWREGGIGVHSRPLATIRFCLCAPPFRCLCTTARPLRPRARE
jgi:hypothetical protein